MLHALLLSSLIWSLNIFCEDYKLWISLCNILQHSALELFCRLCATSFTIFLRISVLDTTCAQVVVAKGSVAHSVSHLSLQRFSSVQILLSVHCSQTSSTFVHPSDGEEGLCNNTEQGIKLQCCKSALSWVATPCSSSLLTLRRNTCGFLQNCEALHPSAPCSSHSSRYEKLRSSNVVNFHTPLCREETNTI
jgi:hypothetical protein